MSARPWYNEVRQSQRCHAVDVKRLLLVSFSLFLVMAGFGIIIPALPYYTEQLQGNSVAVGFTVGALMGSYSLVQFLFSPLWGHFSDRLGRKPIFLVGLLGFALSFFLMGSAQNLAMLFAARILGGMLTAATLPSAFAMVSDLTTAEKRGSGMAMAGAMMGMGFVFGPAIGGILADRGDFRLPFHLAALAALLTFVVSAVVVRESKPANGSLEQHGFFRGMAAEGAGLWPWLTLSFLQTMVFSGMETTLALYYHDEFFPHASSDQVVRQVGMLMGMVGLVAALFAGGGVGKLIRRLGEVAVARLGFVLFMVGFAGVGLASTPGVLTGALIVVGLGSACMRPSLSAGVSKAARTGQGAALGLQSSFDSLARVCGPLIGGGLYVAGMRLPFMANAGLSLAGLALAGVALATTVPAVQVAVVNSVAEAVSPAESIS
ncbi:MAG: MFS transporter [Cyanobacteria bacterium REEB65]|nr:MFS transporter [Cyanobacteria bacterium REEB65]